MIKNGIYSGVTRKNRPVARILATVFGVLAFLLICFIVWSASTFKGDTKPLFVPQAQEISDLKIQVEAQTKTIDELRAQIVTLKEALAAQQKKTAELIKPEEPAPEQAENEETTEE